MKRWQKIVLIIAVLIVAPYAAFMAVYFPTSEPPFCGSCHVVKPYYLSWQQLPHKNVKCLFCHESRGFMGKIHSKSRGLTYVYRQWTKQYTVPYTGIINETNCVSCHLGDTRQYPDTLRMNNQGTNHYALMQEGRRCVECHLETGHKTKIYLNPDFEKQWKISKIEK